MCHINAWFPSKLARYGHMETFWKYAIDSTSMNRDGFGLWTPKNIYRYAPKQRLPHWTTVKSLMKGRYIITHQRLSTSGRNNKMIHPYVFNVSENCQLVGIHNGVVEIDTITTQDLIQYSDSYYFFKELAKSLANCEIQKVSIDKLNEEVRIALQSVLQYKADGRLSILFSILVKNQEYFYYYRNGPSMSVYSTITGLYFSTATRSMGTDVGFTPALNRLYYIDTDISKLVPVGDAQRIKPKYEYKPSNGTKSFAGLSPKMQKVLTRAYETTVSGNTMFAGEKAGFLKLYNMLITNKKLIEVLEETTWEIACAYFAEIGYFLEAIDDLGREDLDYRGPTNWQDADSDFMDNELPFLNKRKTYEYNGQKYQLL